MYESRTALPNHIVQMLSASAAILVPKGSANSSSRSRHAGTTGRFTSSLSSKAPFEVKGFRLFDKVVCKGEEGFIFGRRSSEYFDVRKLDGTRISAGISYKKLHLLEKRRTYLTEIRKEEALPPPPEGRGLRA